MFKIELHAFFGVHGEGIDRNEYIIWIHIQIEEQVSLHIEIDGHERELNKQIAQLLQSQPKVLSLTFQAY